MAVWQASLLKFNHTHCGYRHTKNMLVLDVMKQLSQVELVHSRHQVGTVLWSLTAGLRFSVISCMLGLQVYVRKRSGFPYLATIAMASW